MEGSDRGLIKILSRHLLGLNEKKKIKRKISVGDPTGVPTEHRPFTRQKRYFQTTCSLDLWWMKHESNFGRHMRWNIHQKCFSKNKTRKLQLGVTDHRAPFQFGRSLSWMVDRQQELLKWFCRGSSTNYRNCWNDFGGIVDKPQELLEWF